MLRFIGRTRNRIKQLENENNELRMQLASKDNQTRTETMAALMQASLGMNVDFSKADRECLPPHYLADLTAEDRMGFIGEMETIRRSERFQKLVSYLINLFAFNTVFRESAEEMKRNQAAVIGFRTLLRELDKMHAEYEERAKRNHEPFDDLAILPD